MGGSNMQNTCKCCATHPRQQSTSVDSLGRSGLVQLLRLAAKEHDDTTMMKQRRRSNVNDDGNDGDGGDSGDDGNGMAMVTMPLPLPTKTMLMTMTAAFRGRR